MKRIILPFMLFLSLNSMSQGLKTTPELLKVDGKYKVEYKGTYFDVDTTMVTIKHKNINAINIRIQGVFEE